MKRVLLYSTAYYPLIGGAEVAIAELTQRLPEYDFELITARLRPNLPRQEKVGRILVHRFGWGCRYDKIWLALFGGFYGRTIHQQKPFDLVWGIMASYGGFAAMAFKKREPNIPFLLTLQEGDDLKEVEQKVRFVRKKFLDIFLLADRIQAISSYLADWAKELGGKSIEVIPNGVDLKKFKIEKSKWKITNDDESVKEKIIVSASRLVKKNGIADLILSLKFLPISIKLKLLGDGEDRKYLEQLVNESGLTERVDFIGTVATEDLPRYYQTASVFVRPSYSEGLGNAFLEAMACGLPVIGTNVGGLKDFLFDGQTGFVCEVGNPESIAAKISFILDPQNKIKVEEVIERAEKLVKEKYDWDNLAEKMKIILSNLN